MISVARTPVSRIALGLALALGSVTLASAPAAAAKKDEAPKAKYTPAVQNAAAAAQKAILAGDTATGATKIAEAKAAAQTDDDRYIVGAITLQLAQKTNDQAQFREAVDMMLASGKVSADQLPSITMAKAKFAYQDRDNKTAEAMLLQAQQLGSTDEDLIPLLVESQAANGKVLLAIQTLNAGIDKQTAAAKPVPATWFQRGINIGYAYKSTSADYAQVREATVALTGRWLAAYPTGSNWRDSLVIYRDMNRLPADIELDNYRLIRTANALKGERDYMEYVEATYLRFPGEAKAVLDEGVAANQVRLGGNKNASDINGIVTGKVAADKASLAAAAKGAATAATGKAALSTADAYLGYGQWQQAIDLYKVALAKGGIDADTANLHMGMALARSGQKDAAKAAFAMVKGARAQLAAYWMIYIDHPVTA